MQRADLVRMQLMPKVLRAAMHGCTHQSLPGAHAHILLPCRTADTQWLSQQASNNPCAQQASTELHVNSALVAVSTNHYTGSDEHVGHGMPRNENNSHALLRGGIASRSAPTNWSFEFSAASPVANMGAPAGRAHNLSSRLC
jgi:hypothetical protein